MCRPRGCAGYVGPASPLMEDDHATRHNFESPLPKAGNASVIYRPAATRKPPAPRPSPEEPSPRMMEAVRTLLEEIGEDPEREGIRRTPYRYAKALKALTAGYTLSLDGAADRARRRPPPGEIVEIPPHMRWRVVPLIELLAQRW